MRVLVLLLVLSWLTVPGPLTPVPPSEHSLEILNTDPMVISVPACGHLHIQIMNAAGNPVMYWARDEVRAGLIRPRLTLATLPNGIYLLRINCSDTTRYHKLVVRNYW